MVKRIPCRVVSSVFGGQFGHRNSGSEPPVPSVSSSSLDVLHSDDEKDCFPMGMFVDVIIGD